MNIYVSSLDFDGCLSRGSYNTLTDFFSANKSLIDFIKQAAIDTKHTIFVGSNRQSISLDLENAALTNSGSCFTAIQHISHQLLAEFDHFSLGDIYLNLNPGQSIRSFLEVADEIGLGKSALLTQAEIFKFHIHAKIHPLSVNSAQFIDPNKINLLYAQMHKISSENKADDSSSFNFFDDRDDILTGISGFFKKNLDLIPRNVTLNLHQYSGPECFNQKEVLLGSGVADPDYAKTVTHLGNIGRTGRGRDGLNIAFHFTPEKLEDQRQGRRTTQLDTSPSFFKTFENITVTGAKDERSPTSPAQFILPALPNALAMSWRKKKTPSTPDEGSLSTPSKSS